jgi:hypothetical protein
VTRDELLNAPLSEKRRAIQAKDRTPIQYKKMSASCMKEARKKFNHGEHFGGNSEISE